MSVTKAPARFPLAGFFVFASPRVRDCAVIRYNKSIFW